MRSLLLVCLTLCSCAQPAPPPVVPDEPWSAAIQGPATAAVGELVVLTAEGPADERRWLSPAPHLVIEDGRRLAFAAREPGSYRFVLAAARASTADLALLEHVVRVEGVAPRPKPDSFAVRVRAWYAAVASPAKAAEALRLAQAFEAIAAQIAAGTLREPAQILAATAESNRLALGPAKAAWTGFFESLRQELNQRTGALDYAGLWREIAAELRASGERTPGQAPAASLPAPRPATGTPSTPSCPGGVCPAPRSIRR